MDNVWTNLGNRLETAWKRPTRPNSKRPKDGEIIDEEKSVRWNREEAVRRQKAWDAECSRLKKAQNAEIEHISEAIELQNQEAKATACHACKSPIVFVISPNNQASNLSAAQ